MEPLKVGDLCITLAGSLSGDIPPGMEVEIISVDSEVWSVNFFVKFADSMVYSFETKSGLRGWAHRRVLMKINPDPKIKLEQLREAIKA